MKYDRVSWTDLAAVQLAAARADAAAQAALKLKDDGSGHVGSIDVGTNSKFCGLLLQWSVSSSKWRIADRSGATVLTVGAI